VPRIVPRRVKIDLGHRIIELRKIRGLNQAQLAEAIGLDERSVRRLESGDANVDLQTLIDLAVVLDTDLPGLFTPPTTPIVRRPGRPSK